MIQQQLVPYIRQLLQQGYQINYIEQYLVQSGYQYQDVLDTVNYMYAGQVPQTSQSQQLTNKSVSTIKLSNHTLVMIAVIILFVISGSFLTYKLIFGSSNQAEPTNLDVIISLVGEDTLKPGDELVFLSELTNFGSERDYDVLNEYRIYSSDNRLITKKEETIAVGTKMSSTVRINLPSDLANGMYKVEARSTYGSQSAESSFIFKIKDESIVLDNESEAIQNTSEEVVEKQVNSTEQTEETKECPICDDKGDCFESKCGIETDYVCEYIEIKPCCGNNNCELGEDIDSCSLDCSDVSNEEIGSIPSDAMPKELADAAKEIASQNVNEAVKLCDKIDPVDDERDYDKCFSNVARASKNPDICDYIKKQTKKDNCYANFAIDGDYSVCDKIQDTATKKNCNLLKDLSEYEFPEVESN